MKYGALIFGASEEHQKQQRKGIKALAKAQSAEVKWFVEEEGRQKRDTEDREELQACARYCRTNNATFALSSLSGFTKRKWQALTWLKHQIEMHDLGIAVADDPTISKSSLHVLSAAADIQRKRIAEKSKAALDNIKRKLDAGEKVIAKRSGRKFDKLGLHKNISKSGKLGNQAQAKLAAERDAEVWPVIERCLAEGMGYTAISRHLNLTGVATPNEKARYNRDTLGVWYASTVRNIVLRRQRGKNE
tara:strand:- start:112 stop:852 length:741 start_codon:yes stop_codon:yes gene_type:complete